MTDVFYVYVLFRWNGKPFYVGMGRGKRWLHHEWARSLTKRSPKTNTVKKTLRVLGEVPKIKVAEGLSRLAAADLERALIAAIGRYPEGPLVNITEGGEGSSGYRWTTESRRRLSEIARRRPVDYGKLARMHESNRGRPLTAAHRAKIAAGNRAKDVSAVTRQRMSEAAKKRRASDETRQRLADVNRGRKHSPETVAKMRRAKLGKPMSAEAKAKLRIARLGLSLGPHKPETREKIRQAALRRYGRL